MPEAENMRPRAPVAASVRLDGVRVLVVEDNDINQLCARELLEQAGAVVLIAENGKEALDLLDEQPVDCVLMDVQMPVLDGYSATRQLRKKKKYGNLPIIAMTANAMAGDRERALESGMNDYVSKPVEPNEMRQAVHRWTLGGSEERMPQAAEAAPEPRVTPLDLDAALRRASGNRTLLIKMMQRFSSDAPNFAKSYAEARTKNDLEVATRLAHSMKGSAGTIGLMELQAAAGQLEAALREKADEQEVTRIYNVTVTALSRAVRLIDEIINSSSTGNGEHADKNPSEILTRLRMLRLLVEDADTDAARHCRDLAELLPTNQAPLGRALLDLTEAYDFPKALVTVDQLISELS